jgi:aminoglycoside phosphotransferase (APT) family kinase protein
MQDPQHVAVALAEFVAALRRIDATDGPVPQRNNRGLPLAPRDRVVRAAVEALGDRVDAEAVVEVWESTLAAPEWDGPPTWFHGDLLPGNLLMHEERLSAVIDFGTMGIGDPACDVMPAWAVLPAAARATFRDALGVDDATWERGRGWALSVALIALPYYWETNLELAGVARRTISEVLADRASSSRPGQ